MLTGIEIFLEKATSIKQKFEVEKRLKETQEYARCILWRFFIYIFISGDISQCFLKVSFCSKENHLTFSKSKEILNGVKRELLNKFNSES